MKLMLILFAALLLANLGAVVCSIWVLKRDIQRYVSSSEAMFKDFELRRTKEILAIHEVILSLCGYQDATARALEEIRKRMTWV